MLIWPQWQVSGVSQVQVRTCLPRPPPPPPLISPGSVGSWSSSASSPSSPSAPRPQLKGRVRPRDDIWPLQWPSRAASVISHSPAPIFISGLSWKLQERTVEASLQHRRTASLQHTLSRSQHQQNTGTTLYHCIKRCSAFVNVRIKDLFGLVYDQNIIRLG